ncbi:hypothetical protein CAPTEDRAFT_221435 [Capitella teleta]|uniref:Methyltransferase FkbM domain-containing protein n=1 Tax=Capitella teleta TaxID=283909 RepID=R7TV27_CAPTE|nr:hypothetical protein CAPTEDRAFT_221435 [Capitella teleta]|eukprot:ELT97437.1 hypothetical protein CAPTEDRAFT_221435 [Capitella teleta]
MAVIGFRRFWLMSVHSYKMQKKLALLCLCGVIATFLFWTTLDDDDNQHRHGNKKLDDIIAEIVRKDDLDPAVMNVWEEEFVDPQLKQMQEEREKGIVWGDMRKGKTFASDLGLRKPTKPPVNKKSNLNIKYFSDVSDIGYINDSIDSKGLEGGKAHCRLYDVKSPSYDDFECLNLTTKPKTAICLYPDDIDIHISRHIREEGIWEPHMVINFKNILYANPHIGVIDIGANLGQYSLIAASMGHPVVAVEPYASSLKRFHKAIEIGGFQDLITVVQNAISNERHSVEMREYADNQGGVSLTDEFADPWCEGPECPAHTRTIVMDDLLEVMNFDEAIMKIDIEGHEHRAFVKSLRLLSQVKVLFIIMEWIKLREYHGSEVEQSMDKTLVFQLVNFLHNQGYFPYSLVTSVKLKRDYWFAWPDDIVWRHISAEALL